MEHGTQGRYVEGYALAHEYNLKFLFGAEAYWVKDRTVADPANCHIYIGARNENGRQCINDVLSEANISGFYRHPRLDIPLILSLPPEDVFVTSACVAYWKYDDIEQITEEFAKHFGKNFYLEVQNHATEKQAALNKRILLLRDRLKLPIIMGCDSHYIFDRQAQDRTDFLESKEMYYDDEAGWFLDYPDGDTAYQRFRKQGVLTEGQIDEAMGNTNVFLDVEEYDGKIFDESIKMPSIYPDWTQEAKDAEYERLIWAGWDQYKKSVPEELHHHYEEEIQSEVETVKQCKMSDYFLLDYEVVKKGKENGGLLTKTGRGSAVSFFTNMLLGFTEVDRIAAKVKMYPARFMSAERILQSGSLPDIDLNMADQEPFALAQKQILGEDHSYPMISYGTMKNSAAWKLYAKSQGVPFDLANAVSEQIKKYEEAVKQADEDDKKNIDPLDYIEEQYHEVFQKSVDYRGITTSWSIAPCGYLLYQGSIRREIGLIRIKDHLCCMMDGHWAEEKHFLKNDLLKVSAVELIYKAYRRVGVEPPTVNELLELCPPDDPAWELYAKRRCLGLNQVEREGTAARVAVYKPKNISELCAFVASIRPGFKSMFSTFQSRVPFSYGVKAFDDLIQTEEMPQSFVLYQEMEMAALNYAGIPMSECYTAIKNIAKKRSEKVMVYKEKFLAGFKNAMIQQDGKAEEEADEIAHKLWQIIEDSSRYSFNASHSYCVSLDSLYSAWVKAHHPVEFYETLLRIYEAKGDKDKLQIAKKEASQFFGIKFPPCAFGQDNRNIIGDPETGVITNSIASIKGFGAALGDVLYELGQCKYEYFVQLLFALNERGIKAAVDTLIKLDYFKAFGNQRELLRIFDWFNLLKQGGAKKLRKEQVSDEFEVMVSKYATDKKKSGEVAKFWTITDMNGLLIELESAVLSAHMENLGVRTRVMNYIDIMGTPGYVSWEEADKKKLFIKKVFPVKRKKDGVVFGYNLLTQSVGSGKESSMTVFSPQFKKAPVKESDVIYCKCWDKDGKYFRLRDYEHIYN